MQVTEVQIVSHLHSVKVKLHYVVSKGLSAVCTKEAGAAMLSNGYMGASYGAAAGMHALSITAVRGLSSGRGGFVVTTLRLKNLMSVRTFLKLAVPRQAITSVPLGTQPSAHCT